MRDYIDKIKTVDNEEFDIHDARMQEPYTTEDKEKVERLPEPQSDNKFLRADYTWQEAGIKVIPNPVLSGEEPDLKGLQVGNDKFKLQSDVITENGQLKISEIKGQFPVITINDVDYYHDFFGNIEQGSPYSFIKLIPNYEHEGLGIYFISNDQIIPIYKSGNLTTSLYYKNSDNQYISISENLIVEGFVFPDEVYYSQTQGEYVSLHTYELLDTQNINKLYVKLNKEQNNIQFYYNLVTDIKALPISEITDNIHILDIKDKRIPAPSNEGKFLKDDFTWDTVDALPDRTSAQVNDVLKLDNNKEPVWDSIQIESDVITITGNEILRDLYYTYSNKIIKYGTAIGIIQASPYSASEEQRYVYFNDLYWKKSYYITDQYHVNTPVKDLEKKYIAELGSKQGTLLVDSDIQANPTLSGSETELTSLGIGNTKYKIPTETLIETTYSNLKSLRDNSQLIPGMRYRITDYVTTTVQAGTIATGDTSMDLVVTAISINDLAPEAQAVRHDNSGSLSNMKIWYCLDNDIYRFAWADEVNGKGVIYRMIDGSNNDCPYDFHNIKFLNWTSGQEHYLYTFDRSGSLAGLGEHCYNNTIKPCVRIIDGHPNLRYVLPQIIFSENYSDTRYLDVYNNTIEGSCYKIFAKEISGVTIGKCCHDLKLPGSMQDVSIDNFCYNITISSPISVHVHIGKSTHDCTFYGIQNCYIAENCSNIELSNCTDINIAASCSFISGENNNAISYAKNIIIDSGCKYITLTSDDTSASSLNYLQNVHIHLGVQGTSSTRKTIIIPDRNLSYTTEVWPTGTVNMMID